jgi:hypothetical protein
VASHKLRARAVLLAGEMAVTGGVWDLHGRGWALVVGGVFAAAFGLLVMDVDAR